MKKIVLGAGLMLASCFWMGCEIGVEQPSDAKAERAATETRQDSDLAAGGPTSTPRAGNLQVVSRPRVAYGGLEFVTGYQHGFAEASRHGKPMMLFFTAPWCEYCRQMGAEAFSHPQVVQLSDGFVCVLVDADVDGAACRQFAVSSYPTIQFLSPRGVALGRMVGKQPPGQLMMAMQAALQHVAVRSEAADTVDR